MTPKRKQRLILTLILFTGAAVAITLALLALRENINLFFAPTEVQAGEAPRDTTFRLGGMVVAGSIHRSDDGLEVRFDLTDTAATVTVLYTGILPDLFGEGQSGFESIKDKVRAVFWEESRGELIREWRSGLIRRGTVTLLDP